MHLGITKVNSLPGLKVSLSFATRPGHTRLSGTHITVVEKSADGTKTVVDFIELKPSQTNEAKLQATLLFRLPIATPNVYAHPLDKIIALQANTTLQVFDILNKKLVDSKTLTTPMKYWKYLNLTKLALVDQYHLSWWIPQESKLLQVCPIHSDLADFEINEIDTTSDESWIYISATKRLSADAPLVGKLQIYNKEKNVSQVLTGHAVAFFERPGHPRSLLLCMAHFVNEFVGCRLIIVSLPQAADGIKKAVDIPLKDKKHDTPCAIYSVRASTTGGQNLAVLTRNGQLFVYEMENFTLLWNGEVGADQTILQSGKRTGLEDPSNGFTVITSTGDLLQVQGPALHIEEKPAEPASPVAVFIPLIDFQEPVVPSHSNSTDSIPNDLVGIDFAGPTTATVPITGGAHGPHSKMNLDTIFQSEPIVPSPVKSSPFSELLSLDHSPTSTATNSTPVESPINTNNPSTITSPELNAVRFDGPFPMSASFDSGLSSESSSTPIGSPSKESIPTSPNPTDMSVVPEDDGQQLVVLGNNSPLFKVPSLGTIETAPPTAGSAAIGGSPRPSEFPVVFTPLFEPSDPAPSLSSSSPSSPVVTSDPVPSAPVVPVAISTAQPTLESQIEAIIRFNPFTDLSTAVQLALDHQAHLPWPVIIESLLSSATPEVDRASELVRLLAIPTSPFFAATLARRSAGSTEFDPHLLLEPFWKHHCMQQGTALALDALSLNRPEDGALQTRVIEENLKAVPALAMTMIQQNLFSHYDRPHLARLFLAASLPQVALSLDPTVISTTQSPSPLDRASASSDVLHVRRASLPAFSMPTDPLVVGLTRSSSAASVLPSNSQPSLLTDSMLDFNILVSPTSPSLSKPSSVVDLAIPSPIAAPKGVTKQPNIFARYSQNPNLMSLGELYEDGVVSKEAYDSKWTEFEGQQIQAATPDDVAYLQGVLNGTQPWDEFLRWPNHRKFIPCIYAQVAEKAPAHLVGAAAKTMHNTPLDLLEMLDVLLHPSHPRTCNNSKLQDLAIVTAVRNVPEQLLRLVSELNGYSFATIADVLLKAQQFRPAIVALTKAHKYDEAMDICLIKLNDVSAAHNVLSQVKDQTVIDRLTSRLKSLSLL